MRNQQWRKVAQGGAQNEVAPLRHHTTPYGGGGGGGAEWRASPHWARGGAEPTGDFRDNPLFDRGR